jgi:Tol biopolymer transport system component
MACREQAQSFLVLVVTCGAACAKPAQYDPPGLDGSASDTADRPVVLDFGSEAGAATNDSATNEAGRTEDVNPNPADGPSDLPSEVAPTTDTPGEAAVVAPPAVTWELISAGMTGVPANGSSSRACLSADGRYVVFLSDASNLVPGDTNGLTDVFRFDRLTKTTERVSVATDGTQADKAWRHPPSISADGRYVVFISSATNLVPGDTNGTEDVFLRDIDAKRTTRVSVSSTGAQLSNQSAAGAISGDGSQIVFLTTSPNVLPGLQLSGSEAFLVTRTTGAIARVTQGTENVFDLWISHDASIVASLSNKPPGETAHYNVHQTNSRTTTVVGALGANVGSSVSASLSDDGRFFAFDTFGDPATGQSRPHGVYLLDRQEMKLNRVSALEEGDPDSYGAYLSGDGRFIAFSARLQPRVLDRVSGNITRLPIPVGTAFVSDLSRDGRFIAITTNSSGLPGASGNIINLYVGATGR